MDSLLNHLSGMGGFLGISVAFLIQFATIIWRISRAEYNIYSRIAAVENADTLQREAIKQDIIKLRLDIETQFLKKDSFRLVVDNIDQHLIRLEAKLDAAISSRKS